MQERQNIDNDVMSYSSDVFGKIGLWVFNGMEETGWRILASTRGTVSARAMISHSVRNSSDSPL